MLSAHNRILLLTGGLALAASLTIQIVFVETDAGRATIQAESESSILRQSAGDDLMVAMRDQQEGVSGYLIAGQTSSIAQYEKAIRAETAATDRIRAGLADDSAIAAALGKVSAASAAWRADFGDPAIDAALTGTGVERQAAGRLTIHAHDAVQAESTELIAALDVVDLGLHDRSIALNFTRALATELGVAFELLAAGLSLWFVRRYGLKLARDAGRASVLNRFTELSTFALDDQAVAMASLDALVLLVEPDSAVIHVLNPSKDRAVPEARFGAAVAEVLPMHALSHCPGVIRSGIFVNEDATAQLSVHCSVYPADRGTVACVPLALGDNVGAVHLSWDLPRAFPLELRAPVARIAQHAALAITNRRLLAALQGQADTDARTGLSNSRAFDHALEGALTALQPHETLGVLMLDLDHFKDVNDRHGHPAGDEALRAFAGVLRSCMRDGDLAARYGGEEFAVFVAGVDEDGARAIAERIRSRTESNLYSLAPGVTERLTVSIGLAMAPDQSIERLALLRLADEALYDAKQSGRNRVSYLGPARGAAKVTSGRGGSAGQLGGKSESPARDPEALTA